MVLLPPLMQSVISRQRWKTRGRSSTWSVFKRKHSALANLTDKFECLKYKILPEVTLSAVVVVLCTSPCTSGWAAGQI